jgi:hypothetical protein
VAIVFLPCCFASLLHSFKISRNIGNRQSKTHFKFSDRKKSIKFRLGNACAPHHSPEMSTYRLPSQNANRVEQRGATKKKQLWNTTSNLTHYVWLMLMELVYNVYLLFPPRASVRQFFFHLKCFRNKFNSHKLIFYGVLSIFKHAFISRQEC